jgi:DNA-binding transcriptional LysR family regulator
VLPESVRGHLRSDLTCVPVPDAPLSTVVIAWPERSRSLAIAAFIRAASAVAARRRSPVAAVPG